MGWDLPKLMNAESKPSQIKPGTVWIDDSVEPAVTKRWDGERWIVVEHKSEPMP